MAGSRHILIIIHIKISKTFIQLTARWESVNFRQFQHKVGFPRDPFQSTPLSFDFVFRFRLWQVNDTFIVIYCFTKFLNHPLFAQLIPLNPICSVRDPVTAYSTYSVTPKN